jgi:hypothetical protein
MVKNDRRNFIKKATLGISGFGCGIASASNVLYPNVEDARGTVKQPKMQFNMCGYAAPEQDKVRVGMIGLGRRYKAHLDSLSVLENAPVTSICDQYDERVEKCQKILEEKGLPRARGYSGNKEIWKSVCEDPDVDLIYICTPWDSHAPMAIYAMECGKHVAIEVPAARTLDECWRLVETSERTRKHCMMLENCCYDFFELLTLNMARHDFFGEIIYGEGAYIHDLLISNFNKDGCAEMWRLKENASRNGNLYPTHGLGPICQIMNINRGDKMEYLVSMQSDDFQMGNMAEKKASEDPFFNGFTGKNYRGNMNTTVIKTNKGRTILVQHDVTSPRPYSRIHLISGTRGIARKYPMPAKVSAGHEWFNEKEMKELEEKYRPQIIKQVGELAKQVGGHGGMDFIMNWRLIDCLKKGLPLDQDVYDAALWSAIAPLSEWSVAHRSNSIDVPDFTCGTWKINLPVNPCL